MRADIAIVAKSWVHKACRRVAVDLVAHEYQAVRHDVGAVQVFCKCGIGSVSKRPVKEPRWVLAATEGETDLTFLGCNIDTGAEVFAAIMTVPFDPV